MICTVIICIDSIYFQWMVKCRYVQHIPDTQTAVESRCWGFLFFVFCCWRSLLAELVTNNVPCAVYWFRWSSPDDHHSLWCSIWPFAMKGSRGPAMPLNVAIDARNTAQRLNAVDGDPYEVPPTTILRVYAGGFLWFCVEIRGSSFGFTSFLETMCVLCVRVCV